MSSRRAKLRPALGVIAAGCISAWLWAASCCNVEHLFESTQHRHDHGHDVELAGANSPAAGAEPTPHEHGDAAPSHRREKDGRGSHHHDDPDGFSCSTLHATAETPQQALAAPAFHAAAFLCLLQNASEPVSTKPQARFDRHARSREWVFTPEVSLGPAFRSHAPPVSSFA